MDRICISCVMVLLLYYLKNQNISALTIKHLKGYSHYTTMFSHMNFHAHALHVISTYEQSMEKTGRAHQEALSLVQSQLLPDISIPVHLDFYL